MAKYQNRLTFTESEMKNWDDMDSALIYSAPNVTTAELLIERIMEEDMVLEEVLRQITVHQKNSKPRIRGEKFLLYTTLREHVAYRVFKQHLNRNPFTPNETKLVTISNVKFYFSKPAIHVKKYCVCSLTTGSSLFLSRISKPDEDGIINFSIDYTFYPQPADFKIHLQIYVLTLVKKQGSERKFGVDSVWCHGGNKSVNINWRRSSLFTLHTQFDVNASHANRTNEFILDVSTSRNLHKVVFDVETGFIN